MGKEELEEIVTDISRQNKALENRGNLLIRWMRQSLADDLLYVRSRLKAKPNEKVRFNFGARNMFERWKIVPTDNVTVTNSIIESDDGLRAGLPLITSRPDLIGAPIIPTNKDGDLGQAYCTDGNIHITVRIGDTDIII